LNVTRILILISLVSLVLGIPLLAQAQQAKQSEDVEWDVLESVLRHQIKQTPSALYFVNELKGDPPDEFMERFSSHTPPVKKGSQSYMKEGAVTDTETGRRGTALDIDNITIVNNTEAMVVGGFYEQKGGSSENVYYLKRIEGHWSVVKDVDFRESAKLPLGNNEQDVAEAVFRRQTGIPAGGYFLSIGGKDPTDDFMKRFSSNTPPVKKKSQSYLKEGKVTGEETDRLSVILNVYNVIVIGTNEAIAIGGYYQHGLAASENVYFLKRIDGRWTVVKDIPVREA
jgi:hypothetical protein